MCGICGKLSKNAICRKCEIKLEKQALFQIDDYSDLTSNFKEHLYIFHYDGIIRDLILDYKFKEKSYIYRTFSNFLIKNEKMCVQIKKYDIIMPIPISKKRFKERGYNQSDLLAKDLAKRLCIKYEKDGVVKIKDNLAQSSLSKEEREENVRDVYKINEKKKSKFIGKRVLLIDDIFTTGNTANECSKILIEKGVAQVGILTIARD